MSYRRRSRSYRSRLTLSQARRTSLPVRTSLSWVTDLRLQDPSVRCRLCIGVDPEFPGEQGSRFSRVALSTGDE